MIEHFFICPYCWQEISMLLDPDMRGEKYVEDCQVCCNPIEICFWIEADEVTRFEAVRLQ